MKHTYSFIFGFLVLFISEITFSQAIIIDHNCSKLEPIPEAAIIQASQTLHIAYGHTSHGSQLITGMTGLIGQTNLVGYKGDIYEWNEGGTGGALDIDDYFVSGDLGHNGNTQWATDTRPYLDNPDNSDVNVVIWSWCGGCSDNTYDGIQIYLDAMNQLEIDYPDVQFVYMTGHTDIWHDAVLKANNQQIRDYCTANNKILYDYADIESYDPDDAYFEFVNDNCNYYDDETGSNLLGNWATEWQNLHTEGVDWYDCSASHSQALNGNLKAYAAWWLWCKLSGWEGTSDIENQNTTIQSNFEIYPNPVKTILTINSKEPINNVEIIDITGKLLKTNLRLSDKKNIDVSDLKPGIYFIKINNMKTLKFIKI